MKLCAVRRASPPDDRGQGVARVPQADVPSRHRVGEKHEVVLKGSFATWRGSTPERSHVSAGSRGTSIRTRRRPSVDEPRDQGSRPGACFAFPRARLMDRPCAEPARISPEEPASSRRGRPPTQERLSRGHVLQTDPCLAAAAGKLCRRRAVLQASASAQETREDSVARPVSPWPDRRPHPEGQGRRGGVRRGVRRERAVTKAPRGLRREDKFRGRRDH